METMAWHFRQVLFHLYILSIVKNCSAYPVDINTTVSEEVWGPVLASVALLAACAVLTLLGCVCCRQNKSPSFQEFSDTTSNHSLSTAGFVNPLAGISTPASASTEFTIFPPAGAAPSPVAPPEVRFEPLPDIRPRPPLRPAAFTSAAPAPCELLDEPSFPRDRLKYLREIGKGWFGKVVEGEALEGSASAVPVAVRILRDDAPSLDQALFLREVASLRAISHPNLLRVLGCCCEAQPLLIIMELCPAGDLKNFLVQHRHEAPVLAEQGEVTRLMCELASGLEHMAHAGFIHTDLAARNCQLTTDCKLKIGDYGTSIEMFRDEYYCAGDVAVPIRWCAPESLVCTELTIETKQVTSAANVWTLGVVLWEILEFGQLPHGDLSDDEVILGVLGPPRRILTSPSLSLPHSQYLYHLMKLCWSNESERPTAGQILAMLRHLHSSRNQASSENFEQRWAMLRPNQQTLYMPTHQSISPSVPCKDGIFHKSPSLQNLRGSLEDLSGHRASSLPSSTDNLSNEVAEVKLEDVKVEIDETRVIRLSHDLFSSDNSSSLEDEEARKICEAIQDLDDALALEQTSSSEEETTPREKYASNSVLDFRLQVASDDSDEEETIQRRVERGEFTEKVRQKSRSVQDLMVLTHIDSSSEHSSDDTDIPTPRPLIATSDAFKSEGNIRGAIVIEGLLDSFRQLQKLARPEDFSIDSVPSTSQATISKNCYVSVPVVSNNFRAPLVSQEEEFLSSSSNKYLISEKSASPDILEFTTSDNNTPPPDTSYEEILIDNNAETRNEMKKKLLLNLDNLDNTPSSQSCSVTTSTDESDLTILVNPNLDTPLEADEITTEKSFKNDEIDDEVFQDSLESGKESLARSVPDVKIDFVENVVDEKNAQSVLESDVINTDSSVKEISSECVSDTNSESVNEKDNFLIKLENTVVDEEENCNTKQEQSDIPPDVHEPKSTLVNTDLANIKDLKNNISGKPEAPMTSASLVLPLPQDVLNSKKKNPLSMIAFEPPHPKHHKRMRDFNTDYEISKFKCKDLLHTEAVGMIAFDTYNSQYRQVANILSPEPIEDIVDTKVVTAPLVMKVERKPLEVTENVSSATNIPLSTIAFEYVSPKHEALILDTESEISKPSCSIVDKTLQFKPKRLGELCQEALILEVSETPKVLEKSSMEAIILDVDSTIENIPSSSTTTTNIDNLGALDRLESLINNSDSTDSLLLHEKGSDLWSCGDLRSKLENLKCEESKRVTPDDDQSSDSGFREKTASVGEEGEKYNLEDIEVELETFAQLGTPSSDSGLERTPHDDLKSFDSRGDEDEGDAFWKQQMASLHHAAGKTMALFQEAANTDLSPCDEEKAYTNSWFRKSDEELSPKSGSSDNSYISFGIDDECVAAIRNELQQKLPKLERQNSDNDIADGELEEEEEVKREDITIHYNIYPAPLSPILEEQESLFASENCSPAESPGFFLHAQRGVNVAPSDSLSNSGINSPRDEPSSPVTSPKHKRSEQFEADIRAALEQCSSSEQAQEEDVLFVDTETNEAKLVESPLRAKLPYLAFVNGQQIYSGPRENDEHQWVEDDEQHQAEWKAHLDQFDAVTSFSEADPVSWMCVPSTRAPMPSPEEELARRVTDTPPTSQTPDWDSSSACQTPDWDGAPACQTPDWESDSGSEASSSSGEFVWKEGDRQAEVKAVTQDDAETTEQQQITSPAKTFDGLSDFPMAAIAEEDEDAASTSSSGTEFIPSSWNSEAEPSRSSLRSPERKSENKKNVSFKRQKYHCVYEYPREASDTEADDATDSRRQWGLPQAVDYASYADWELLDDELTEAGDQDTDPDSSENTKPESYDFYKISNIECDFTNGVADDGEFYISSSTRPFQLGSASFSSQFFPGLSSAEKEPTSPGGSSGGSSSSNSTTPPSPLSPASMGELRHTKDRLKLDLSKFSLAPITPRNPVTVSPEPSTADQSQA